MTEPVITVERFIHDAQKRLNPDATGTLSNLLGDIILAAKIVSLEVNKAGLLDILGDTEKTNVQGETVRKLDDYANDVFINCLNHGRHVCGLISEEMEEIHPISATSEKARYVIALDPLDGSSNIDVNVSIGSIFSIYKKISDGDEISVADFLQSGSEQVAAGYIIYGSSTMFVFTTGRGTHGFTLDPGVGEFILSHPNIHMPLMGKYYSVNESNALTWAPEVRSYIDHLKSPDQGYSTRYIGSLVADFHRNLLKGGVFCYPASTSGKLKSGKLRLMYEANPMAFLIEQAGGQAIDGTGPILERMPESIHERVPLFMGSKEEMKTCLSWLTAECNRSHASA